MILAYPRLLVNRSTRTKNPPRLPNVSGSSREHLDSSASFFPSRASAYQATTQRSNRAFGTPSSLEMTTSAPTPLLKRQQGDSSVAVFLSAPSSTMHEDHTVMTWHHRPRQQLTSRPPKHARFPQLHVRLASRLSRHPLSYAKIPKQAYSLSSVEKRVKMLVRMRSVVLRVRHRRHDHFSIVCRSLCQISRARTNFALKMKVIECSADD
jgi:hypothetical protein